MATGAEHRDLAARALAAAQHLRPSHAEWALVPLFYSAMHLLHAWFDENAIPVDQRHPETHRTYRSGGQLIAWGTTDVVAMWCAPASAAYKSLFNAGRAMRYSFVQHLRAGADQRLWDDYEVVRAFVGDPPS